MTMLFSGAAMSRPIPALSRTEAVAAREAFDQPTLVLDPARVAQNYQRLAAGLGTARIHYAVKANPDRAVLAALLAEGASFDAASRGEIELCLALGARPDAISFGNTVKKASDIAFAHRAGIRVFAVDAEEEVAKVAAHAPGAEIYVRMLITQSEADWPLSRKFGCDRATALHLFAQAGALGLRPVGLSFHVGSQTREAEMWAASLDEVVETWRALHSAGHRPTLLNIGGGFPAFYGAPVAEATAYARRVVDLVKDRFGPVPRLMAEPGRGLVADAGTIACEVMLVARKSADDAHRWVYLDIGKFSGLAETIDEAIRYPLMTPTRNGPLGPCILAGPSCDSADVLYERRPVLLPLDLASGDRVLIRNAGAYTTSYASVGFNGFPPLATQLI